MVNFFDKKKRGVWLNPHEESSFSGICPYGVKHIVECLGLDFLDSYHSPCSVINKCSTRHCEHCLKEIQITHKNSAKFNVLFALRDIPIELVDRNVARSFVYWISDGEYTKIGKANSISKRIKQLQTGQARELYIERAFGCKSEQDSIKLESYFHKELKRFQIRNEWFAIPKINLYEDLIESNEYINEMAQKGLIFGVYQDENGCAPGIGVWQ